jgi:hypothetical protein
VIEMKIRIVDEDPANDMISYPPDTFEHPRKDFTCFKCVYDAICRSRYDLYNLDGDCLEEK